MTGGRAVDVGVVIVGLNARDYVLQCLDSLSRAEWRAVRHRVVYVDNGSRDGSLEAVERAHPEVLRVANGSNVGFCRAANLGARHAACRYFYFVNDDTIVLGDAIARLVELMDRDPGIGSVGSRLVYPDGSEQWSGRRFPSLLNAFLGRRSILTRLFPRSRHVRAYLCKEQLEGGVPFEVDWVSAAGQIVSREAFEEVGGFAEDYYYWHEAVFCDRLRRSGRRVLLDPRSRVIHFEGKGSGVRPLTAQRFHIVDFHRGAYRCYCEHHGLGRWHPRRWMAAAGLASRALLLLGLAYARASAHQFLRGARMAWAGVGRDD